MSGHVSVTHQQMTAYYNEIEPNAAAWLRELIKEGEIAPGEVDERSIVDVRGSDLAGFTQCHFFAGIGGWSLALRYAGWGDHRPVWTGSCPCQPFSAAGKRKGFADDRHLWPEFKRLIAQRRPSIVFGEQVASAAEWLRLVRSDLEALEYAVGAMPIEAASAGADHLRDRYWFVAHAHDARRQGRQLLPECADQRAARPDGVADAESLGRRAGLREISAVEHGNGSASDGGVVNAESVGRGEGRPEHEVRSGRPAVTEPGGAVDVADRIDGGCNGSRLPQFSRNDLSGPPGLGGREQDRPYEWAIGADGKARRVKPGVRLLVDGFPSRVGLLRGFGNAIDPRPAAQFIAAAREAIAA